MKKLALALAFLISCYAAPAQAAGVPVFDSANLTQAAANFSKEFQEMLNQLQTMKDQLAQQTQQYQSLVGDRGMGQLLDGQVRNYIPSEWKDALAILDNPSDGYSQISARASQILEQNSILSSEQLSRLAPEIRAFLEEEKKALASYQALIEISYKNSSERFHALQTLTNNIGAASDPKAIMDLQARIESEQVQLQNESNKLQNLSQAIQVEEYARDLKLREFLGKSAGKPSDYY